MSDGSHGMLRGQMPANPTDQDYKGKQSMPKRSQHDTEHERQAVGPQAQHRNKDHTSTGYTSKIAGIAQDDVMNQAITDKLTQTMQKGIEDGWNAREEEEEENAEVTAAQIDAAEDAQKWDDDDSLEAMRQKRRDQMKEAYEKKLKYQALGHGDYIEIEEENFLTTVTASERCVVHFYHLQFEKCKIMDMHLRKIAKKFMGTRFVRMDSEKAPFFTQKLGIQTLPCAVVFSDHGVAKGRQVGFEGLDQSKGDGEFSTIELAFTIKMMGGLEENFEPDDDLDFNS